MPSTPCWSTSSTPSSKGRGGCTRGGVRRVPGGAWPCFHGNREQEERRPAPRLGKRGCDRVSDSSSSSSSDSDALCVSDEDDDIDEGHATPRQNPPGCFPVLQTGDGKEENVQCACGAGGKGKEP
ncbi:hypothetical protein MHYP_G00033670 [Metynnis hypsauchen]